LVDSRFFRIDWIIILTTFALVGIGLVYQYSAASSDIFAKQISWVVIGILAMATAAFIDYRFLLRHAYSFYAFAMVLLVVVLQLPAVRGAQSWIRLPGFNIQPTEFMKLALILTLARYLMLRENQHTIRGLIMPFALALTPTALILKQPDLGSAILIPPTLLAVVYASSARLRHLIGVCLMGVASVVPMWMFVMKGYQKRRVLAFLDPDLYEAREAYQLIMSLIAIGSGRIFGAGLGKGTQTSLDLLPDKHTDFIFGVIAEEGGFVVASIVLMLFLLLVCEGYRVAVRTREPGGRLIAIGCATLMGVQVAVNIGVVTAMLPTTGITLPLISYGGSSMVVTFVLIGLLLNVGMHKPMVLGREAFERHDDE